jgi:hypothetical protein
MVLTFSSLTFPPAMAFMDIARALLLISTNHLKRFIPATKRFVLKLWITHPFVIVWALNLWFFEIALIYLHVGICSFERISKVKSLQSSVVVIADPQLTDKYSYKQKGIALWITEFYSDYYMKRNFRVIQHLLNPQVIIFAGDLMDGAREWDNKE